MRRELDKTNGVTFNMTFPLITFISIFRGKGVTEIKVSEDNFHWRYATKEEIEYLRPIWEK